MKTRGENVKKVQEIVWGASETEEYRNIPCVFNQ